MLSRCDLLSFSSSWLYLDRIVPIGIVCGTGCSAFLAASGDGVAIGFSLFSVVLVFSTGDGVAIGFSLFSVVLVWSTGDGVTIGFSLFSVVLVWSTGDGVTIGFSLFSVVLACSGADTSSVCFSLFSDAVGSSFATPTYISRNSLSSQIKRQLYPRRKMPHMTTTHGNCVFKDST